MLAPGPLGEGGLPCCARSSARVIHAGIRHRAGAGGDIAGILVKPSERGHPSPRGRGRGRGWSFADHGVVRGALVRGGFEGLVGGEDEAVHYRAVLAHPDAEEVAARLVDLEGGRAGPGVAAMAGAEIGAPRGGFEAETGVVR